jgi:ABC-type transport system involved in cytochrome bd biosynthesis fused ATPase/permease subunit
MDDSQEGSRMTKNLGTVDRALRALVGILALAGAFALGWFSGWMVWAAAVVGVIMLVTAAVGMCPIYRLVGINTCRI